MWRRALVKGAWRLYRGYRALQLGRSAYNLYGFYRNRIRGSKRGRKAGRQRKRSFGAGRRLKRRVVGSGSTFVNRARRINSPLKLHATRPPSIQRPSSRWEFHTSPKGGTWGPRKAPFGPTREGR